MIKDTFDISSSYFICAAVKDSSFIKNDLIKPIVTRFFDAQEIDAYEELPLADCFSDIEYNKIAFEHIYGRLLVGITKKDKQVEIPVKYILTIDKINCNQRCRKTDTMYDTIDINDRPFLYFIYIDINSIIMAMRKFFN